MASPAIDKVFWSLTIAVSYLVANSAYATDPEPIYYQDCSYVEFDDIDNDELTRNEEIALIDENFFAALDRTADCMNQASASGAERIGEAAGSSGAGAGGSGVANASGSAGSGDASGTQTPQPVSQTTQETQSGDTTGVDTQRGSASSGSSAVCDAVKEGLASATTKAEKDHWQGLSAEYGC